MNRAREAAKARGAALRGDVVNTGRGMPSAATEVYGMSLNSGNAAVGNQNATADSAMAGSDAARGWYQTGIGGLNDDYSNRLSAYSAKNDQLAGFGQLAGLGLGLMV
jgi:hypothetical protein